MNSKKSSSCFHIPDVQCTTLNIVHRIIIQHSALTIRYSLFPLLPTIHSLLVDSFHPQNPRIPHDIRDAGKTINSTNLLPVYALSGFLQDPLHWFPAQMPLRLKSGLSWEWLEWLEYFFLHVFNADVKIKNAKFLVLFSSSLPNCLLSILLKPL